MSNFNLWPMLLVPKDDPLLAFIRQARALTEPASTGGALTPTQGGHAMPDNGHHDLAAYLRALQGDETVSAFEN